MGIGRFAFTPLLPLMMRDGTLDATGGAELAAANYLGYLVGALSAGRLARQPLRLVLACLPAIALLTAAAGLVHSMAAWSLLRFGAGVCSAWAMVAISTWCLGLLAQRGRSALGGPVFSGVGAGITLAGLMAWWGGALPAHLLWLLLGGVALLLGALVWGLVRLPGQRGASALVPAAASPSPSPSPPAHASAQASIQVSAHASAHAAAYPSAHASSPASAPTPAPAAPPEPPPQDGLPAGSWPLVVCYGSFGLGYILPATFLPAMARALLDDPRSFGVVWPVFGLAAMASTGLALGALARWPVLRVWSMCQFLMAAGVALPVLSGQAWAIGAAALLVGSTFVLATVIAMQQARALAPQQPAALIGRMTVAFALGQIAGPLLVRVCAAGAWGGGSPVQQVSAGATLLLLLTAGWLWRAGSAANLSLALSRRGPAVAGSKPGGSAPTADGPA